MAAGELMLDWGFAETLAYALARRRATRCASPARTAGRGTFFHRHAVLHDQKTGARYVPLEHLKRGSAALPRDRLAALGRGGARLRVRLLDHGPRTASSIWEAQFGDFANGAQVIIDQFISSGEAKWGRFCGLVLFLPHGYEGQGPEHSSARLERFLQLTRGSQHSGLRAVDARADVSHAAPADGA